MEAKNKKTIPHLLFPEIRELVLDIVSDLLRHLRSKTVFTFKKREFNSLKTGENTLARDKI